MATSPYKYVRRKSHPLTTPSRFIPEHRLVLYDAIGPGPHPCHWCSKPVDWLTGHRTGEGALVVDHLDCNQRNNALENLAPSCHACNQRRPFDAMFEGKQFVIEGGRRTAAVERTCQNPPCGRTFLIAVKLVKHGERIGKRAGRYCSRSCMYAGRRS